MEQEQTLTRLWVGKGATEWFLPGLLSPASLSFILSIGTQLCLPAPREELGRTGGQEEEGRKVVSVHCDDHVWTQSPHTSPSSLSLSVCMGLPQLPQSSLWPMTPDSSCAQATINATVYHRRFGGLRTGLEPCRRNLFSVWDLG